MSANIENILWILRVLKCCIVILHFNAAKITKKKKK